MARLIDADALKEHIKRYTSVFAKYDWREICEMLNDAPTVDAVEVVLCQDCIHRDPEDHKCDCGALERAGCMFPVADDYFCSWGERGENDIN